MKVAPARRSNFHIMEVVPERLGWAPEQEGIGGGVEATPALQFCQYGSKEGSSVGKYRVYHYPPSACGRAFGPLGFDSMLRFCRGLEARQAGRLTEEGPLVLSTPVGDQEYRANAAVLLGAYLILCLKWSVSRVVTCLGAKEADATFVCAWARADRPEPRRILRVRHCWQGLDVARQHRWIDTAFLQDDVGMEKACNAYNSTLWRYDAAWIIPRLLMVSADPRTVLCDPNPVTCNRLFPSEDKVQTAVDSGDKLKGKIEASADSDKTLELAFDATVSTRDAEEMSDCDSCDTVCKEYGEDSICKEYGEGFANDCDSESASTAGDHDYVTFLRRSGIGMVVQANFADEEGMPSNGCGYTHGALEPYGICQARVNIVDTHGGLPKPSDVARLLRACDGFMQGQASDSDAVMCHCKGGFGRSVVLACCLAISRWDVPGAALLGWIRIMRPGAFTVHTQEAFLESLRSRKHVHRYAKVPLLEADSDSVHLSCGMPCRVQ
mmetsp:Transcript_83182/g.243905  ORF Transcript_83182/g.243905 Transcript_83182/m.243905 type:complete len:495 (+) Transcript_83182:66-1550(+)